MFFNLSAIAASVQISNEQEAIEHKEKQPKAKEKIDISVAKPDCADNKSNNWPDLSFDSEKYSNKDKSSHNWAVDTIKNNIIKPNNKYDSYNNDFHVWANKVNDSIKRSVNDSIKKALQQK